MLKFEVDTKELEHLECVEYMMVFDATNKKWELVLMFDQEKNLISPVDFK